MIAGLPEHLVLFTRYKKGGLPPLVLLLTAVIFPVELPLYLSPPKLLYDQEKNTGHACR
jgi:hypothetical protein